MDKRLPSIILVTAVCFFFSTVSLAYAQVPPRYYDWSSTTETHSKVLGISTEASQSAAVANFDQFTGYFLGGNLTPATPFFFLKPLQENIRLLTTADPKQKEDLRIAIAGSRLAEMKKMANENQVGAMAAAASYYQQSMNAAVGGATALKDQPNFDSKALLGKIEQETAKHNVILEEVSVQVPDQTRTQIQPAIAAAWNGTDTMADLANRPAVPPDVVDRIQALKAQGMLTSEEATQLINVKSRSEARTQLSKYVTQGVMPASDFLRMDENVKALYPDEFYKIHETKRFYELKTLESQKPDPATLTKIQDFAKTYKQGEIVPPDIRKYWAPVVRLEEIQNTLRPDLIDPNLLKNNQADYQKFTEVVNRFKPRPEDVAYLNDYLKKNPNAALPPEYERMKNLADQYGAQCGSGYNWVPVSGSSSGGYCAPQGAPTNISISTSNKSCSGPVTAAKGPGGTCSAFSSDCIPAGWSRTDTCSQTPNSGVSSQTGSASRTISCPSNAHFVPVPYSPDGGYCLPNYTSTANVNAAGGSDVVCSTGTHREYPGGPCLPNYSAGGTTYFASLPPITATPGNYPNPFYPNYNTRCGNASHFVPEPINPNGGYCAPDNYNPGIGVTTVSQPGNGIPRADMGNCRTPGECYDFCKTNPGASSCTGFNPSQPRPGDAGSRESQEAACRSGGGTCTSWNNGICACGYNNNGNPGSPSRESQESACRAGGGTCQGWYNGACSCTYGGSGSTNNTGGSNLCQPTAAGCPNGYWDYSSCNCRTSYTYPSTCSYAGSCGSGSYWDQATCSCRASQPSTYNGGTDTCPSGYYRYNGSCIANGTSPNVSTPPSGYGTCSGSQYWNGSACVTSSYTPQSAESSCRATSGCSWNGSSCNCSPSTSSSNTPPPPPSYSDPATACASTGGSWNGSSCQMPSSPPPSSPPPSSPPPSSPPPSSPPPSSPPPPPSSPPPSSPPPSSPPPASPSP